MQKCCADIFTDTLAKCPTEITVNAQLAPATDYVWVITNFLGNKYQGEVTTDANGFFSIPITDLPEGLLTQYNGTFVLEVFLPTDVCKPVPLLMARKYDSIQFEITAGNYEKSNLGCEFTCVEGGGAASGEAEVLKVQTTSQTAIAPTEIVFDVDSAGRVFFELYGYLIRTNIGAIFDLSIFGANLDDISYQATFVNVSDGTVVGSVVGLGGAFGVPNPSSDMTFQVQGYVNFNAASQLALSIGNSAANMELAAGAYGKFWKE